jgi:hypothetical protein
MLNSTYVMRSKVVKIICYTYLGLQFETMWLDLAKTFEDFLFTKK